MILWSCVVNEMLALILWRKKIKGNKVSERIIMNIKFCTEKDLENVVNMYGLSISWLNTLFNPQL